MRKKWVASVLLTSLLALTLAPVPSDGASSAVDRINREIEQLKRKQAAQKQQLRTIDAKIGKIKTEQKELEHELMVIDLRRNEAQNRLNKLDKEIDVTTAKAQQAQQQLDEAVARVEKREGLLKTRVKTMYERGSVSYLEVLLGASSFGDFLTRLDGLKLIVEQDTRILEDNIRDKELIEQKKQEIDHHLAKLENMFAQVEELKAELDKQYKRSLVVKAELAKQVKELHEIREEEEQELQAAAAQMTAKMSELSRLLRNSSYTGGKLFLPLPPGSFRITSHFGYRKDPFTGRTSGHNGMDLAARQGTDIYAAADGVVILAGYYRGYGNTVMIKHNEEITTLYGHIREGGIKVKVGQFVKRGQKIAEVGSTGRSTGPHLHFTVYKNNQAVDPRNYLR